jgi:hypothetical protein
MKQVCLSKDYSTGIHSEKASCCKEVKHMPKKTINWNGILQLIASIMICVWGACTLDMYTVCENLDACCNLAS